MPTQAMGNKITPSKVRVGHKMCVMYWVDVVEVIEGGDELRVRDLTDDKTFYVQGAKLVEKCYSADTYDKVMKVTQTEMIDLLMGARNMPFSVIFEKKSGEKRLLRGKIVSLDATRGYTRAIDFDVDGGDPIRMIDHRTLETLILDNVRYEVK